VLRWRLAQPENLNCSHEMILGAVINYVTQRGEEGVLPWCYAKTYGKEGVDFFSKIV
jgi:hypothetical protein